MENKIENIAAWFKFFTGANGAALSIEQILIKAIIFATELAYYLFLIGVLITSAMYLFGAGSADRLAVAKKNFLWLITGFIIAIFAFALVNFAASRIIEIDALGLGRNAFNPLTAKIFSIVTAIAGAGFLVMLLTGGFRYLISSGNEEETSKAKTQMIHSGVGILLVVSSYAIGMAIISLIYKFR